MKNGVQAKRDLKGVRSNEELAYHSYYRSSGLYVAGSDWSSSTSFFTAYALIQMASAAGIVLAAGGIAAANEAIFVPISENKNLTSSLKNDTNLWRLVPATAILALVLTGLEKVSEPLGKGLAGLILLAVLIIPVGNAPTPLENLANVVGVKK